MNATMLIQILWMIAVQTGCIALVIILQERPALAAISFVWSVVAMLIGITLGVTLGWSETLVWFFPMGLYVTAYAVYWLYEQWSDR